MADFQSRPRLSREKHGRPAASERIIHLGLGNFARAHQAWFTEHAPDSDKWGIAAFTGRSMRMVNALEPQGDVYTLITSAPQGDTFEVISSVSSLHSGLDTAALRQRFADPHVSIVTSTVTEAGYVRDRTGELDTTRQDVKSDIAALKKDLQSNGITTIPMRVVAGLLARRAADAGPITILPCDNLMQNGAAFRTVVEDGIEAVDPSLMDWASQNVDWATSMVDRITPATTDAERQAVADSQGWYDASPVRTEPFREWVIQGSFPSGRPQWEQAGVTLTDDVVPFEQRKLWMLNGSHSTLAYCGSLLGFETVADAIADPRLRKWIDEWWDLAGSYLSIPSDDYRRRLVERFSNPRIHHHLFQIASDGSQKLPVRIVPVAKKALAEGKSIVPPARTIGAWILFLRTFGAEASGSAHEVKDADKARIVELARGATTHDGVRAAVGYVDADLGRSESFVNEVENQIHTLQEISRNQ